MENRENSFEIYSRIDEMLKKLYLCTKQEEIENVFKSYDIQSFTEKIELLKKCMAVAVISGTPEETTEEDAYEFDCKVFLEGSWRLLQ